MTPIILMGVFGLFLVPPACAEGGYSVLEIWDVHGSGNGQFEYPHGIAINNAGNIYVADTNNSRVQKFDSNGTFITKWGTIGSGNGQFNWPAMIAFDNAGSVYVIDERNNRIQKFDSNGAFIATWGTYGSDNGQFYAPEGIAIDTSGNVYVADTGNNRVQKFDSNGTFITKWGALGSGNGQFNALAGIAVGNAGNVYVADSENNRVQKFDSNGTFITKWGFQGSGKGQFDYAHLIAVDNLGNVYVSDWWNSRIQKFGPNGAFITQWGTDGWGVGQFDSPGAIAINSSWDVYVADAGNNRIQVFSPDRFADTPLDYWATPYIEVIYQAGYTTGYGGTNEFRPEYEVTREQMAVFILRALNEVPADGYCGSAAPFLDVAADRWSCKYIKRLVELGITVGLGQGLFGPEEVVTREQMAGFLTRALGRVPADGYCGSTAPFPDVAADRWSCGYIKRLVELGITAGIGGGFYGPQDPVTRAQMAAFLYRAFLVTEPIVDFRFIANAALYYGADYAGMLLYVQENLDFNMYPNAALYYGADYAGMLLYVRSNMTPESCMQICRGDAECTFFYHNARGPLSLPPLNTNTNDCAFFRGTLWAGASGNSDTYVKTDPVAAGKYRCADDPECTFFYYNARGPLSLPPLVTGQYDAAFFRGVLWVGASGHSDTYIKTLNGVDAWD
jgi:DNA-binding beta-propeller fold protein YncE